MRVEELRRRRLRVGLGGDLGVRRPARSGRAPRRAPRPGASPPSSDGVPPPTNTVSTGGAPAARRPTRSSVRSAVSQPSGVAPPSSAGRVGVEVAVPAPGRAERHVDVDAERPAGRQRSVPAKARPDAWHATRHSRSSVPEPTFAHREQKFGPVRASRAVRGRMARVTAASPHLRRFAGGAAACRFQARL